MFMQLQQKKTNAIALFSAGFQQKSKQDTHSPSCLFARLSSPSTDMPAINWKSKEKEQVGQTSPTLALDCKHANHVCQIHLNFQLGWEHHKISQSSTQTEKANNLKEHPVGQSILFWQRIANSRRKTSPSILLSLALCNRHSWWGRWHRRRICHNFVAEAATVTIGTSALQNVTANGPADRRSKHSLWSQS